jgi:hypothetical protein
MPIFSKTNVAVSAANAVLNGTKPAISLIVEGKEIGILMLSKATEEIDGVKYPLVACACGQVQCFAPTQAFQGRPAKEKFNAKCSSCGLRLPGSCRELLVEASAKNIHALKVRICPKTARPMIYVCAASPGKYILRCSFANCECTPIPLQEVMCAENEVTLLPDEFLSYLASRGFSQCLKVSTKGKKTLDDFMEATKNVSFFPAAMDEINEPTPKAIKKKAPKKVSEKKVSVKEISKKNSAAAKKPVPPKKKNQFIDDEAEEASVDSEDDELDEKNLSGMERILADEDKDEDSEDD